MTIVFFLNFCFPQNCITRVYFDVYSEETYSSLYKSHILKVAALFVEIVLVGTYGELIASWLIADYDGMWVHLEH